MGDVGPLRYIRRMIKFSPYVTGATAALLLLSGCTSESGPVAVPTSDRTETSPSSTPSPESTEAPSEPDGTRAHPWPADVQAKYDETSVWTFSIGPTATDQWSAISAVNEFSEPPADGNSYITAPVTLTVASNEQTDSGADPYGSLQITYVTSSGTSGKECLVQLPPPGDIYDVGTMYGGATVEFLACAEIPSNEVAGGTWAVRSLIDPDLVTFFAGVPSL